MKEKRLNYAKEMFESLGFKHWTQIDEGLPQGGNSSVCVIEHQDGRKGVFRCLPPDSNKVLIERFNKEIPILSEKIKHKNVINLYDWSRDPKNPWYISELGIPFQEYWKAKKKVLSDPNDLANNAVEIVKQIASGLAICHNENIIHRDIKLKNIVFSSEDKSEFPVIIDFGIAFDNQTKERLTPTGDAVGNARFSPDIMRNRMEYIPAWIDVFELSQILIWMLDTNAPKHYWQRPVHWKYASYNNNLSSEIEKSIRAFTASCSFEQTSPANGSEALFLLENLFPSELSLSISKPAMTIKKSLLKGKSDGTLMTALINEEMESCLPMAQKTYQKIKELIETSIMDIRGEIAEVKILRDSEFNYNLSRATTLYSVYFFSEKGSNLFVLINIKCFVVTKADIPQRDSFWMNFWKKHFLNDCNCFTFSIEAGVPHAESSNYTNGLWITQGTDGTIYTYPLSASLTHGMDMDIGGGVQGVGKISSFEEILSFMRETISKEEYWEYIGKQNE